MSAHTDRAATATSKPVRRTRRRLLWAVSSAVAVLVIAWFAWDAVELHKLNAVRTPFRKCRAYAQITGSAVSPHGDEESASSSMKEIGALFANADVQNSLDEIVKSLDALTPLPGSKRDFTRLTDYEANTLCSMLVRPEIEKALMLAKTVGHKSYFPNTRLEGWHRWYFDFAGEERKGVYAAAVLLRARALSRVHDSGTSSEFWNELRSARNNDQRLISAILPYDYAVFSHQLDLAEIAAISDAGPETKFDELIAERIGALKVDEAEFQDEIDPGSVSQMAWLEDKFLREHFDWIAPRWQLEFEHRRDDRGIVERIFSPFVSAIGRPILWADLRDCYQMHLEYRWAVTAKPQEFQAAWSRFANDCDRKRPRYSYATLMGPSEGTPSWNVYSSVFEAFAARARQRLKIMLLAALRHRRDHGVWASAASDLGLPANITTDPGSGQPLVIRARDGELIAYAFGLDGVDDGGRPYVAEPDSKYGCDVVIRIRPKLSSTTSATP